MWERVVKAAEGAALGTGTKMEYEIIHGVYNLMPNEVLSKVMFDNLNSVGGVNYDSEEEAFAQKVAQSFGDKKVAISNANTIMPFVQTSGKMGGSTDVGDISWVVPTAGMRAATWVPGTAAHSWQAVAAGGTTIGKKGMLVAAKTIALSAYDLFTNPELTEKADVELKDRIGAAFKYEAILGDRKPPLDYRK